MSEQNPPDVLSYKPSGYYFRAALRAARTKREAVELGLAIVAEHEQLREWARERGMIPPKWFVTPIERASRAEGSVVPFCSTGPASEKEV